MNSGFVATTRSVFFFLPLTQVVALGCLGHASLSLAHDLAWISGGIKKALLITSGTFEFYE